MKKLICILAAACFCASVHAQEQEDSLLFTPEYLDTVNVNKAAGLNDYFMIGANYGVSLSTVYFNPDKMGVDLKFKPTYFSVMFTHYEKMFNYLPYFGVTVGMSYWHSGVRFNDNPETGYPLGYIDGATDITMETVELPAMMQMHFDSAPMKVLANLGGYVGYRLSVERSGPWLDDEYTNAFRDYEYRFDYGLVGGAGLGFMLDPVEIHLNLLARWSLQNLYAPDYYNETFHPYNTYYYRYANPIDLALTVGVYFQLTKRTGKTTKQIKQQAREYVYGSPENN